MKKTILAFAAALAAGSVAFAQDKAPGATEQSKPAERTEMAPWPVWLQFNSTENLDIAGLRLNIPHGVCDTVTGVDAGFVGSVRNMYGLQANILRNNAIDTLAGVQIGVWNSAGVAELASFQFGLWNEAGAFSGAQVGAVNIAGTGEGFQLGLINRAESLHGYQVGVINVIRSANLKFMPIVNIGF